eukprot:g20464.t1
MGEGDNAESGGGSLNVANAVDIIWIFFCLVLVTLMQPGFACYEVGAISGTSSIRPILLKNIGDASVSLVAWICIGYALSSGKDKGGLIGGTFFALTDGPFEETGSETTAAMDFLTCLYRWSFAAACTTIISGAVADRIPFKTYIIYAFLTSAIFYPVLAHWVWAEKGWASPYKEKPIFGCGVLDFAGSGVVHMCGGGIGLIIAKLVTPRRGRFFPGNYWDNHTTQWRSRLKNHTDRPQINEADFSSNDMAWMTLGGFLLWIGWYGFNCGSTLGISTNESQRTAGRAALNTTIAAAFGCVFSILIELAYHLRSPSYRRDEDIVDPLHKATRDWDARIVDNDALDDDTRNMITKENSDEIVKMIKDHRNAHRLEGPWWRSFTWPYSTHENIHGAAVNGILAGLVGITAGCATMSYASAVWVSLVSALVYHVLYRMIICCKIDDAVGAGAVHFGCGMWGLVAAGFTATDDDRRVDAGYPPIDKCSSGSQVSANVLMAAIILLYVPVCTVVLWTLLSILGLAKEAGDGVSNPRPEDRHLAALKERIDNEADQNHDKFELIEACLGIDLNNREDRPAIPNEEDKSEAQSSSTGSEG